MLFDALGTLPASASLSYEAALPYRTIFIDK